MNVKESLYIGLSLSGILMGIQSYAMFHDTLHPIEKELVICEIQERGKSAILKEIAMATSMHAATNTNCEEPVFFTTATILQIQRRFHEKDVAENPLTKMVFETIERIEKKDGYIPKAIDRGEEYIYATNYFSLNTRYYWLKGNGGRRSSTVRVEANLTNKAALQELVESYKDEV
jgi:hypothetical protein